MHELKALTGYWRNSPPVHVSVAAYLGFGKAAKAAPVNKGEAMRELSAVAGPSRGRFVPPVPIR